MLLRADERWGSMTVNELKDKAKEIRKGIVSMIYESGTGHVGGALSSCDILTVLFYSIMLHDPKKPDDPQRDRFVLSKGHCVEGYYNILADMGYIEKEELKTFSKFQTRLIGHPNREIPGVEMNTGALGHGLSAACGMAKAGKILKEPYRVFCLMGDGETEEGSIWESAMFAANYHLDNLYAILDRNMLQISGPTEEVMRLEPLKDKWRAFGFDVYEADGNDIEELLDVFDRMMKAEGKPKILIADTIKGKGVSFMENQVKWHHGKMSDEEYSQAMQDLA